MKILWLIIRLRPFIKCPYCEGEGGAVSGYYEPEWMECWHCHRYWEAISDYYYDRSWWEGRMPLLVWVRAKASIRAKMPGLSRWRDIICCRLGKCLNFMDADAKTLVCRACFTPRPSGNKTREEVKNEEALTPRR